MRKLCILLTSLSAVLLLLFTSCATPGSAGELPSKWWTLSRGEIQNSFHRTSSGDYRAMVLFVGKSDSSLNITETVALEQARMDAAMQLSRFLAQKVTGVMQASTYVQQVQEAVDDGKLFSDKGKEVITKIEDAFSNFSAMVTTTQFSSFMQEGEHIEKSGKKYVAYVCYSMPDMILQETRMLQDAAFRQLTEETEEYKEIMQNIQEIIAKELEQSILSGIDG